MELQAHTNLTTRQPTWSPWQRNPAVRQWYDHPNNLNRVNPITAKLREFTYFCDVIMCESFLRCESKWRVTEFHGFYITYNLYSKCSFHVFTKCTKNSLKSFSCVTWNQLQFIWFDFVRKLFWAIFYCKMCRKFVVIF